MIMYSSDFETTTEAVCKDETWVWAWGSVNINDENDVYIGNDISQFITKCESDKQSIHYFHNLKFDGVFIMDYLFRELGFRCLKPDEKPEPKTFSILMNKMNIIYSITIYFKKVKKKKWYKTTIYDSLKILPYSVEKIAKDFKLPISKLEIDYDKYRPKGYMMDNEEREYLLHDILIIAKALKSIFDNGDTKMTAGSNALQNFKDTFDEDRKTQKYKYRKLYPVLDANINEDIRKAYKGGYVYVNPNYQNKDLKDMLVFDKNSMYPSHMRYRDMPYGQPTFFEGEYSGNSKFYIQHLLCKFKVKDGYVPTIQLKGSSYYNSTEYIRDSTIDRNGDTIDEPIELYLSKLDLKLFLKHYDIWELEYLNGWEFKTNKGVFNQFIDSNYKIKCNSKGAIRLNAKLRLNSLSGKFATNIDVTGKYAIFENDIVKFVFNKDEDGNIIRQYRDSEYTPLGVAITSYARYDLITRIDKLGGEKPDSRFVYCDTDSVHILGLENPSFIPQDDKKLDYWKKESVVTNARFLRAKTYLEEIIDKQGNKSLNVKCAGMPKNIKNTVTWENFHIGFQSGEKLKPKIVKGGVLLVKTPFEIKE